ncbi:hypothetical protein DPMN_189318 [Dreissena polymorpha]|uniref:Uncharacterized protein n=1 Tax=Dreissena polymorpha TaxID=45954 RepID=A0A9D4DRR3_DREPO|nr:hypothetical protein DPMN_189318 [Dreissena polymorpha]
MNILHDGRRRPNGTLLSFLMITERRENICPAIMQTYKAVSHGEVQQATSSTIKVSQT